MRFSIRDAVARPIPSVYCPVVELQRLQPGDAAFVEHLEGILVDRGRQQHPERTDVLLKEFHDRLLQPASAKAHPRTHFPHVKIGASRVERLLEKGDPRLRPEAATEEEGRVDACRQSRSGDRLGHVVDMGKLFRRDLQVDLEARIARFQHDGIVLDHELVRTTNPEPERAAPGHVHGFVEGVVAGTGSDVVQRQVGLGQRGQDTREDHFGVMEAGCAPDPRDVAVELFLHVREAGAFQHPRRQVGLEVEAGEFGGKRFVVQLLENLDRDGSRPPCLVHQEHLLLGPEAPDTGLDQSFRQEPLHRLQIPQQRPSEFADRFG